MLLLAGSLAVEKVRSAPVRWRNTSGCSWRGSRAFARSWRRSGAAPATVWPGAAGRRVPGRGEDLGPAPVQPHRGRAERAADLALGRGATSPADSPSPGRRAGDLAELAYRAVSAVCWSWRRPGSRWRRGRAGRVRACAGAWPGSRGWRVAMMAPWRVPRVRGRRGAGPGPAARRTAGAGWPRLRRRGGRSRSRPGCRRAGCRLRASR